MLVKLSNVLVVLTFYLLSCLNPWSWKLLEKIWKLDRWVPGWICNQQPCEKSALSSTIMHVSIKFTFPLQMTISYCISPLPCALLFRPGRGFPFITKTEDPTWNFSVLPVYKPLWTWDLSFSSYCHGRGNVLILSKTNPSAGALIIVLSVVLE